MTEGVFATHDSWEVANILWTLANGLIQREAAQAPRSLRRKPLEQVFEDAVELVLRGLALDAIPLELRSTCVAGVRAASARTQPIPAATVAAANA